MIEPEDRWEPWRIDIHLTGGPERIYDDNPTQEPPRRQVGFFMPEDETEPLLWEGDGA